ncbi:spore coat protein I [Clostridium acetireducens DSM 10703]|uniref:Spore coat protein I n=1 Tax=Clostridium acetireducens DSM 10703 TaxID=1121290 RepID=A0A1E8F2A0_9CLOT|nr:CotS family spore coat protein [Clostridium acetireducens]OFI07765.1 spore coat protein I [Clostridium acetireducens DSM 10703]
MEYNKFASNQEKELEKKLSRDETSFVYRILKNYNFSDIMSIYKVRSVYKVETSQGNICLKKFKHGRYKVRNGYNLVKELHKLGFYNTPPYIKTKEDHLFIKYKKYFFYATKWVDGRECDLKNLNEAVDCMKLLAKFHLYSSKVNIKKFKLKNNLKNWPNIFYNNLKNLDNIKKIINKRKIKTEFDIIYLENINTFYNRGILALNLLNHSQYYKFSKEANRNKTICHDSFYYQNIIKMNEEYYIIDLDSIIFDIHVNDVGKLIRRLMSKKTYSWDFKKAKILIESYNSINKLSKNELEIMISLIMFPHKFCKLGKKRYFKHKNWSEIKYLKKLNKILRTVKLENIFLSDYLNYLDTYK